MTIVMPDGIVGAVDLVRYVVAVAAIFAVPGAAWHLALWPAGAGLGRLERMALIPTTSYFLAGAVALTLARLGALEPGPLAAGLLLVVGAGAAASAWRIARGRGWSMTWRRPSLGGAIFVVLAIGLPFIVVILPQILVVFPAGYPVGTITWYYWGLTTQVLDLGRIPEVSAEWGGLYEFQGDYVLFNAVSAIVPIIAGRASDFLSMEALRLTAMAWGMIAALGAFRRFLPRWGALVATLLFFSAIHVVSKYTGYRPESFNYALIFFSVWAVDRFRERPSVSRAGPVVAAIVGLWIGHGVVLVLGGLLAGGIVLGYWVVGRRPDLRTLMAFGAVVVAGFVASAVADFVLQGKILLLNNAVDPARIQGDFTSDLTWQFRQWALGGRHLLTGDPSDAEVLFIRRISEPWSIMEGPQRWAVLALAFVPVAAWRWLPVRARALWVGGFVFLAGLGVVVFAFLTLYDTYVPQRVGFGRLAPFTLLGATVILTVSLTAVARAVAALGRQVARALEARAGPGRGPRSVAGAVASVAWAMVIVAVVALAADSSRTGVAIQDENRLSPDGYTALRWIAENTPADALVLANSYTEGSIGTIAGRNGLLDGRAPYNKEFEFLLDSVDQLRLGRSFYQLESGIDDLRALGVDYVIVSPSEYGLANAHPFCDPEAEANSRLPCFAVDPAGRAGLKATATFGDIRIYRIEP